MNDVTEPTEQDNEITGPFKMEDGKKVPLTEEDLAWLETVRSTPLPPPPVPRVVAMWRARTIMKVTPHGDGTLFEAVQAYIAGMTDPLQKAAAEEALERGSEFDRDGVFVPLIAAGVGIDEPTMEALMEQAHALPA